MIKLVFRATDLEFPKIKLLNVFECSKRCRATVPWSPKNMVQHDRFYNLKALFA